MSSKFVLGSKREQAGSVRQPTQEAAPVSVHVQSTVIDKIYTRMKPEVVDRLDRQALGKLVEKAVSEIADEEKLQLSFEQQQSLSQIVVDDMKGIGPLQRLLSRPDITEIKVIGHSRIYVERNGKMEPTDIKFRDEEHLRSVAQRIARSINRRVDDINPICDARLEDGSRVNIVIPPISLDGTVISIRKFSKDAITLSDLAIKGSISPQARDFLRHAAESRLNIIISGGTSSGKTTLLNALSQDIDEREAIVTIEDSAELRLQQPIVTRLETRPPLTEGLPEIGQRELVRNAVRMRPDRIILGEVRGAEALDMLQAFNTGHDGSMSTLHANTARDALSRLESMVLMGAPELTLRVIRQQIASTVDLIIQAERMSDGIRRVTEICEVTGMEGDTITMQHLFKFEIETMKSGVIIGRHRTYPVSIAAAEKFKSHGLHEAVKNIFAKG